MPRRVAITGVGAVTPLGVGAGTLIERWIAGESGIVDGVGWCADFEPTDRLTRREARRTDRFTQLALAAADEAIDAAGWSDGPPADPELIGCVVGTGIGGISTIEDQHSVLGSGVGKVSPLCVPQMMANAAAGQVSLRMGFGGQCYGTVSACAAGAHAIGAGLRMVQHGDAPACVVGGAEAGITPLAVAAFAEMGATSKTGVSRPFDARRDGFVMGEGAGMLVLEDAELARSRGARPIAYLTGYGATADAHHMTAPEPDGRGAARAITLALRDAGIEPEAIAYVNAHGTSTPLNDLSETLAIKSALGGHALEVPVSSLKSAIGHLLGAAGAVEAVATALALERETAPPTLNLEHPDPELDLDYAADGAHAIESNGRAAAAISSSFGFGGHNAVLCLEAAS